MIARAKEQGALNVVADQRLTPTFTADLAAGILAALDADVTGTLHVTNGDATSWHGFTEAIMELAGVDVPVAPGTTVDRPRRGRPPAQRRAALLRLEAVWPRCARGATRSRTTSSEPACSPPALRDNDKNEVT